MDINTKRYFDACGVTPHKEPFLEKWYHWNCKWFNKIFHTEWELYHKTTNDFVDELLEDHPEYDNGRWGELKEYKDIDEALNPLKVHKFAWKLTHFPESVRDWLCCVGTDKENHDKDRHMLTLLCCNKSFTLWDKLRFYLITGYKYQEE